MHEASNQGQESALLDDGDPQPEALTIAKRQDSSHESVESTLALRVKIESQPGRPPTRPRSIVDNPGDCGFQDQRIPDARDDRLRQPGPCLAPVHETGRPKIRKCTWFRKSINTKAESCRWREDDHQSGTRPILPPLRFRLSGEDRERQ
jgi:hypothetical protein